MIAFATVAPQRASAAGSTTFHWTTGEGPVQVTVPITLTARQLAFFSRPGSPCAAGRAAGGLTWQYDCTSPLGAVQVLTTPVALTPAQLARLAAMGLSCTAGPSGAPTPGTGIPPDA